LTSFALLVGVAAFLAGATSSVAGFGIGTILTPLLGFGIGVRLAVAGALAGALLHAVASIPTLKFGMAALLIIAGGLGVGGFVGNQGGIRAAAMLALDVRKEVFVATAVAIALVVDGARLPIYAVTTGRELLAAWPIVVVASAGVLAGTLLGKILFGCRRCSWRWGSRFSWRGHRCASAFC
jgi:uncharacterized protein